MTVNYTTNVTCPGPAFNNFSYVSATGATAVAPTACSATGSQITLTFAAVVAAGAGGTLTYTQPAGPNSSNSVFATGFSSDLAGNQTLTYPYVQ